MEVLHPVVAKRSLPTNHLREPLSPRRLPKLVNSTNDTSLPRPRRHFPSEYSFPRVAGTQRLQSATLERSRTNVVCQRPRVDSLLEYLEISKKNRRRRRCHRRQVDSKPNVFEEPKCVKEESLSPDVVRHPSSCQTVPLAGCSSDVNASKKVGTLNFSFVNRHSFLS